MKVHFRRIVLFAVAVAVAVAIFIAAGALAARMHAGASPTASRVALAEQVNPIGAHGRTLGLSRVTIPPSVQIPLHHHPGTQIAYIQRGVLTYTVRTDSVNVMRGAADQSPTLVRRIRAGQTGKIRAGEWIVEQPTTIHRARNDGTVTVRVLLATLFRNGDSPSLPVQ